MRATLSAQCWTMILSVSSGGSLTAFVGQFIPINYVISVREERLVAIDSNILRISFGNIETRMFTFLYLNFSARLKNMFSIKREVKILSPSRRDSRKIAIVATRFDEDNTARSISKISPGMRRPRLEWSAAIIWPITIRNFYTATGECNQIYRRAKFIRERPDSRRLFRVNKVRRCVPSANLTSGFRSTGGLWLRYGGCVTGTGRDERGREKERERKWERSGSEGRGRGRDRKKTITSSQITGSLSTETS